MTAPTAFATPLCTLCTHPLRRATTSTPPRRLRPSRNARAAVRMQMDKSPDRPDGSTITQALEIGFRNVWIRLMTSGISTAYEDAIQVFVVACIAAYKAGYSLTALKLELAANEKEETYMGRDVRLNEQEKETRLIWIALVYLTLARYQFESERTPPTVQEEWKGSQKEELGRGLGALVDSVCSAADRGYNLQTYKMELKLKEGGEGLNAAQASVRSQWARIVFATFGILPDGLKKSK